MKIILFHLSQISERLLNEIADQHQIVNRRAYTAKTIEIELAHPLTPLQKEHFRNHAALHACDVMYPKPHFDAKAVKLIAFDMDSTLINIECIDEIARVVGKMAQVSAITEAAMRGEIADFSASLIQRVALLSGTSEEVLREVYEQSLQLNLGAQTLFTEIKALGWHSMVVSGGFTYFANRLKAQLGIDDAFANTLEINRGYLTGKVTGRIIDGQAKAQLVATKALELGILPSQTIVVGDGSNDLLMMAFAGLSIGFRAKSIVKEKADAAFDHVGLDAILDLLH